VNSVWLDRGLLGGAALALAVGFLRPSWPAERALFEQVIVLDVTQSMNVADTVLGGKPASRLAFAKHALRESLLRLPCGSRVGWAVFTEHRSFLLYSPIEVCAHLNELRSTLDRIDGRMAWVGGSEVAKGLHSGVKLVKQLPRPTTLVFVTDGHEAPPLNPRHRPAFDGRPGEVAGLIVGVGDLQASPIPKTDLDGRALGFWLPDEVMQTDLRSLGRGASVGGETMVEDSTAAAPLPDASTGSEHLSSLHDAYLRLLASELGLGYHRLQSPQALSEALTAPALARPVPVQADGRAALGVLALVLLLVRHFRHTGLIAGLARLWSRLRSKRPAASGHISRLRA